MPDFLFRWSALSLLLSVSKPFETFVRFIERLTFVRCRFSDFLTSHTEIFCKI
jgi:hypothetical protein